MEIKTKTVKIHKVSDGPYEEGPGFYNRCLVEEEDGKVHVQDVMYQTLKAAYHDINVLNSRIEPIETTVGYQEEEKDCLILKVN